MYTYTFYSRLYFYTYILCSRLYLYVYILYNKLTSCIIISENNNPVPFLMTSQLPLHSACIRSESLMRSIRNDVCTYTRENKKYTLLQNLNLHCVESDMDQKSHSFTNQTKMFMFISTTQLCNFYLFIIVLSKHF